MKQIALIMENFNSFLKEYSFLNISFLGNKIGEYIIFLILFVFLFIGFRIFKMVILRKAKGFIGKINQDIGGLLISIIDTIKTPFYWFLAFYISVNILNLNPLFSRIITIILFVWIAYQAVKAAQLLIDYALNKYFQKEKDKDAQFAGSVVGKFLKWLLWLFAILLVLSNLGVNVTSVMAGLGIGGLAVALAIQNILNDLFSSFAIYFDKPFVVGDFIVTGEHMGVVEKIGIKTTRLRALQGEEIVISNKELTSSRVQNFKKMKKRRIVFHFGVVYETSLEKLKEIPSIVGKIIKEEELAELDRVNFIKFGDFSLVFEAVYYILSANYNDYMNANQNILFEIKEAFEEEKISIAFPTQTLLFKKPDNELFGIKSKLKSIKTKIGKK